MSLDWSALCSARRGPHARWTTKRNGSARGNMNPNPSTNRRPPHEDVVRRFLDRLNNDPQLPRVYQPHGWRPAKEQLVSMKAAEELARWFRK
jgi:hypothetical protein